MVFDTARGLATLPTPQLVRSTVLLHACASRAVVLAGCGQTGPLYLPGEAPESQTDGPFGMDDDSADNSSRPASDNSAEATDNRVD